MPPGVRRGLARVTYCGCPYKTETVRDDVSFFHEASGEEWTFITGFDHTPECNERRYRELLASQG